MWVLLDDEVVEASGETSPDTTPEGARTVNAASVEASELLQVKLLEERVKAQEELVSMYKTQNSDWEKRYYDLREELAAAHRIAENLSGRALLGPAPVEKQRRWRWPWGGG